MTKRSLVRKRIGRTIIASTSTSAIAPTDMHHPDSNDDIPLSNTTAKRRRSSRLLQVPKVSSSNNTRLETLDDDVVLSSTDDIQSQRLPSSLFIHRNQSSSTNAVSVPSHSDSSTTPESWLMHDWMHHTDVSFHYFTPSEVQQIQSKLLQWYSRHRRRLPWRGDPPPWNGSTANFTSSSTTTTTTTKSTTTRQITKATANITKVKVESGTGTDDSMNESYRNRTYPMTTYGVWVSEIMLQQTRVEAVIVKWCQFMSTFPNVSALAQANIESVNAIWAGLGYYRRLKLLHTAAQMVVTKYNGTIPTTIEELLTLPGIGRYTAHAIASISYHQNVPVVDGNVCRVLSRLRGVAQTIKASTFKDKYGWILAQQLVSDVDQNSIGHLHNATPVRSNDRIRSITTRSTLAGDINQALMELGATYCAPSGTGIHPDDPLKEFYWSTKLGLELAHAIHNQTVSSFDVENGNDGQPCCALCAKHGIHDVMVQFRNQLTTSKLLLPNGNRMESRLDSKNSSSYHDAVQQLGHSLFPLPPPKVHKKEEVIVIAAICRLYRDSDHHSSVTKQWLLVKRQDDGGLLSGQWEFPSISVWQSDAERTSPSTAGGSGRRLTPRVDMTDHVPLLSVSQRRKHFHKLLNSIGGHVNGRMLQTITDEPIHHIFSHIRHTMYIEYTCVDSDWICCNDDNEDLSILTQWKSATDMEQVGITSGVKKILQTIERKLDKNTNT